MAFFTYLTSPEYRGLMLFYIAIWAATVIPAYLSQHWSANEQRYILRPGFFLVSFAVASFFYVFAATGRDYNTYRSIYHSSSLRTLFSDTGYGVEPGYRLLNALLNQIISDSRAGIAVIKLIQITVIFGSIYMLRNQITLGEAVLAYMSVFYFESFALLRISLAGALCLLSIALYLRKKPVLAILTAAYTPFLHSSAIYFCMVFAVMVVYIRTKWLKQVTRVMVLSIIPIVLLFGSLVARKLYESGFFMNRYSQYLSSGTEFGFGVIVYYVPVVLMLYRIMENILPDESTAFRDASLVMAVGGFSCALLSYSLGMMSRMFVFFACPFVVTIPFYIRHKDCIVKESFGFERRSLRLLVLIYWIARLILSLPGNLMLDGLYRYVFIFG